MPGKKSTRKTPTEFFLDCSCGARAQVFSLGDRGYMSHCPGCGTMTFFHNPQLLERLHLGGSALPSSSGAETLPWWLYIMVPDMPSENILL